LATNVGCGDMLDGIIGTCLAVDNSIQGALLGTSILSIAGEIVGKDTINQPYTFLNRVFDTLFQLNNKDIQKYQNPG
jgi:hydroxyethylthiazole kinase